jgi:hypothetical protein
MPVERFPAKWIPVRVKKTRQNKKESLRSDSIGTEKALGVDQGLRAEAADAQNKRDVLERFHLTISGFGAPKSR